jgi:hypothetical protein
MRSSSIFFPFSNHTADPIDAALAAERAKKESHYRKYSGKCHAVHIHRTESKLAQDQNRQAESQRGPTTAVHDNFHEPVHRRLDAAHPAVTFRNAQWTFAGADEAFPDAVLRHFVAFVAVPAAKMNHKSLHRKPLLSARDQPIDIGQAAHIVGVHHANVIGAVRRQRCFYARIGCAVYIVIGRDNAALGVVKRDQ